MRGRHVQVRWPNGSRIVGWIVDTEGGGKNLAFGPDGKWGVMYIPPEGVDTLPNGNGFEEATITSIEPAEFGTVVVASRQGGPTDLWVRISGSGSPGLWTGYMHGGAVAWPELDHDRLTVIRDGIEIVEQDPTAPTKEDSNA